MRILQNSGGKSISFNMTPLIDIVFLLMIFFLVVCQFIEAENFEISVTDNCNYAQETTQAEQQITTITVMKSQGEKVDFAVGPEIIHADKRSGISAGITRLVDASLADNAADKRTVVLRIDKDVRFEDAQFALAGVAESMASNIQLAVLKEKSSQ